MSTTKPLKPTDSAPVSLYYSKPRAALVLGLNLVLALWFGYIVLAGLLDRHIVLLLTGGASLIFFGPFIAWHAFRAFEAITQEKVVVTLNDDGVTDVRNKDSFVAWEDIARISLGARQQTSGYLIFDLRPSALAKTGADGVFTNLVRLATSLGDWRVNLRPLKCNDADVLRAAQHLHRLAMRRRTIERNGPSSQGWSGSL